jgi:anti-sigma factor ChrR (cupin superfamily)
VEQFVTNSFQDYSEDSAATALDILEEQMEFERELATSATLQAELAEFRAAVGSLAYGVPLEPLPVGLKDKLFARLDVPTEASWVTPKPSNLLDLIDWSLSELREVAIDLLDWVPFPMPIGSEMVVWQVDEVNAQLAFFLRIYEAGALPQHWHATGESILVLEGNFIDDDGTVFEVGDRFVAAANTSHQPTTSMGCLILAVTSINDKILSAV